MNRQQKNKRHVPRSIFWKLFFMLVTAGLLIMVLVIGFFRSMFSPVSQDITHQNAENYARYLIQDIGDPPDTLLARQIARDYNLIIYYESDQLIWSSVKDPEFLKRHGLRQWHGRPGWWKRYYLTQFPTSNGKFILGVDFKTNQESHIWMIALLIFFIAFILSGLYLSIRYILRPIQWLSKGVQEVSKGNFDQQVPIWKMDQLGQLTTSFNNMINKIREMITARNQLLVDVSHEMRSPLTRVKVAMEFMPDSNNKKSIGEDITELEQMLTEILETERLKSTYQNLTLVKTDLVHIIRDIVQKYKDAKPGIELSGLSDSCLVNGDIERLKMCLRNVIENSLKFSTENKKPVQISIETGETDHIIKIQDYGQGIPESDLPYIFEPFYRVDKSRSKKTGGYGLGMSLCKKIIEVHKGVIDINSEENKGTIVTIKLPMFLNNEIED